MNTEEDNNSPEPTTGWGDGSAPIPCPPDCEANHQHYYPKTEKVESDPVTVTMKVINSTDQDFTVNCSWCVDEKDQTTPVKAGENYTLQSNTHDASGTVFTVHPLPPKSIAQPDPSEGTFQMTYGYWDGAAHVTCDDVCNNSNPTEKTHYEGCNWIFDAEFADGKGVNSTVTFTTKPYPN